jgi:hypothetical protein
MPFGLKSTDEQLADIRADTDSGYALVHVDTCLGCFLQDHHNRDGEFLIGVTVDDNSTRIADIYRGWARRRAIARPATVWTAHAAASHYDLAIAAIHAIARALRQARTPPKSSSTPRSKCPNSTKTASPSKTTWANTCQAWFVADMERRKEVTPIDRIAR